MSAAFVVAFTLLLLEDNDLFATLVFENLGLDRSSFDNRGSKFHGFALADGKYGVDGNGVTGFGFWIAIDEEDIPFLNRKLPSLCFDCRFHRKKRATKEGPVEKASTFLGSGAEIFRFEEFY